MVDKTVKSSPKLEKCRNEKYLFEVNESESSNILKSKNNIRGAVL